MTQPSDIPAALDTPAFREAWAEWQAHRKDLRKRLTARSAAMALRRLEEMGAEAAVAAISHSIAAGYVGVFADPSYKPAKTSAAEPPAADERWLDVLKMVLRESPEFIDAGWDYERCKATGWSTSLPYSLRQAVLSTAHANNIQLRV